MRIRSFMMKPTNPVLVLLHLKLPLKPLFQAPASLMSKFQALLQRRSEARGKKGITLRYLTILCHYFHSVLSNIESINFAL